MEKKYILYIPNSDGSIDDDCRILDIVDSRKEAIESSKENEGMYAFWKSYDFDGKEITNGHLCPKLGSKWLLRD